MQPTYSSLTCFFENKMSTLCIMYRVSSTLHHKDVDDRDDEDDDDAKEHQIS